MGHSSAQRVLLHSLEPATDNAPSSALAAAADSDGYSGTEQTTGEQRRTLTLSNGEVIWDLAGNVYEWTTQTTEGVNRQPGLATDSYGNFKEWSAPTFQPGSFASSLPAFGTPAAVAWGSAQNVGLLGSNRNETGLRGAFRGGHWYSGTHAGVLTSVEGLEHLFAELDEAEVSGLVETAVAIRYLRVSTTRQMNTGADVDEDGNSIATQREWTIRKTQALKAALGPEFVEPGQSAQTISKRPVFKEMLEYITSHPEVRYVVIYMRSRVFRNFVDAAITKRYLDERGVKLVSAKEEFGEGYMGDAMEAITDVVNELQVRMSGEDIKIKMAHKVEQGGSVGRAKLGYVNARKEFDGRLVNTIDVDPIRAPLIVWAFEQYATGEYSVAQLVAELEEQGLTSRGSRRYRSKPISVSTLSAMLGDPYYTGVMRYKGKLYPGRHTPLISKDLYLKVKEVLASRNRKGDRDRVHFHYLRGLVYCDLCHDAGRTSRLVYSQAAGNGGVYEYYTCTAKLRGNCAMPGIRAEALEDAVAKAVASERISAEKLVVIAEGIADVMRDLQSGSSHLRV